MATVKHDRSATSRATALKEMILTVTWTLVCPAELASAEMSAITRRRWRLYRWLDRGGWH
jgi:hypothetical protein